MNKLFRRTGHVVGVYGGLGNQLFQYTWSRHLVRHLPVSFDLSGLRSGPRNLQLEELGIRVRENSIGVTSLLPFPGGRFDKSARLLRRLVGPPAVVLEAEIEEVVDLASASWWYGYWQDRSIALESIAEIRASLPAAKSSLRTIGIHVRRGDFVNLGLSLPSGYYTRALADVTAEYPGISKVYVYSDDLTWCRSELRPDVETVYATSGSPAADMLSLSTHEYLILSRGTFGWWSSYLRERAAETVVVPDDYLPGDPVKQELLVDPGWRRTPVADPDRGDREHE